MGVMDWLRPWRASDPGNSGTVTSWPVLDYLYEVIEGKSADDLWREQPHLRTVIGFLTRNVAQLGITAFKVKADGSRTKHNSGPLQKWLIRPNSDQTMYEFLESIVGDLALYDNVYIVKAWVPGTNAEGNEEAVLETRTVRPTWIQAVTGIGPWRVEGYQIKYPETDHAEYVPADRVIHIHGYNPVDARVGVSPVSSLRSNLSEQMHAVTFRDQLWKRGGRVGAYLTRPHDAPDWDPTARAKFKRDFASAWAGDSGSKAGGVPLLEDGMELKRVGFAAREEQFVEATKLSLTQVAAAYYINPTMVGILDNANYSNVREFRRMLYGETLGPVLEQISQRLTVGVLPEFDIPVDGREILVFDVEGRTAGTFEEQITVAGTAVGGPVMTTNEYRARLGLPPVDGGDKLNKPLNVTQNGDQEPVEADPDSGPGADDQPDDEDTPEDDPPAGYDEDPDTEKRGPAPDLKSLEEYLTDGD